MTTDAAPTTSTPTASDEQAPGTANESTATADSKIPYLKVFGPDIGAVEYSLEKCPITIGRSEDAHVRLPDASVSRTHATIRSESGQYVIHDEISAYGLTLNQIRVDVAPLKHGDEVHIGPYVMQFRTHAVAPGAAAAAARAKRLLQSSFATLPAGVRCQYRTVGVDARRIFQSGDTLRVGKGGLLLPVGVPPKEGTCLETRLAWGDKRSRMFLGEILGVLEEEGTHWMCVKLHTVPPGAHDSAVRCARRGVWTDILKT